MANFRRSGIDEYILGPRRVSVSVIRCKLKLDASASLTHTPAGAVSPQCEDLIKDKSLANG